MISERALSSNAATFYWVIKRERSGHHWVQQQNVIQNTRTKQEEEHLRSLKHNQEKVFKTTETKPRETFETIEMNLGPLR